MFATFHSSGNTTHLNDRLLLTVNRSAVAYCSCLRIPEGNNPVGLSSGKE